MKLFTIFFLFNIIIIIIINRMPNESTIISYPWTEYIVTFLSINFKLVYKMLVISLLSRLDLQQWMDVTQELPLLSINTMYKRNTRLINNCFDGINTLVRILH